MTPAPSKPTKLKPIGRGYTYVKDKETGETSRQYMDGTKESIEAGESTSLVNSLLATPIAKVAAPSASVSKSDFFADIQERYQRKIDRLLGQKYSEWVTITEPLSCKPVPQGFVGTKWEFFKETLSFRWDVFKFRRKLNLTFKRNWFKREKFTLKQIDEVLFLNFPDEKARNDAMRKAMVRL